MNYPEFIYGLQKELQERVGAKAKVCLSTVEKLNGANEDALVIEKDGKELHLRIYLRDLYEESGMGSNLEACVEGLYHLCEEKPFVSRGDIPGSWQSAKRRIELRLVKKKWNKEILREVPYKEYLDFAVIFVVFLAENEGVHATLTVSLGLMKKWEIELEELWEAAQENLKKESFLVKSIDSVLGDVIGEETMEEDVKEQCGALYVMSNARQCYGARVILRKDILRRFAKERNNNLYLLPCSLHEFLALEDDGVCESSGLKNLVCEMNEESGMIKQEQWLSDSVYYYDREKDEVRIVA